jgi:hypothetical protein
MSDQGVDMCAIDGRSEQSERWAVQTVAFLQPLCRGGSAAVAGDLWKKAPKRPYNITSNSSWQLQMLQWPEVFAVQLDPPEVGLQQKAPDFLLGRPRARQLLAEYRDRLEKALKGLAKQKGGGNPGIEFGRACNTHGHGLMVAELWEYRKVSGTAQKTVWEDAARVTAGQQRQRRIA